MTVPEATTFVTEKEDNSEITGNNDSSFIVPSVSVPAEAKVNYILYGCLAGGIALLVLIIVATVVILRRKNINASDVIGRIRQWGVRVFPPFE